jgi:hypothetical protein
MANFTAMQIEPTEWCLSLQSVNYEYFDLEAHFASTLANVGNYVDYAVGVFWAAYYDPSMEAF